LVQHAKTLIGKAEVEKETNNPRGALIFGGEAYAREAEKHVTSGSYSAVSAPLLWLFLRDWRLAVASG